MTNKGCRVGSREEASQVQATKEPVRGAASPSVPAPSLPSPSVPAPSLPSPSIKRLRRGGVAAERSSHSGGSHSTLAEALPEDDEGLMTQGGDGEAETTCCPAGHALLAYARAPQGLSQCLSCDGCRELVAPASPRFSCSLCDYDLCLRCATPKGKGGCDADDGKAAKRRRELSRLA